jgi:peptidase A4-like protein
LTAVRLVVILCLALGSPFVGDGASARTLTFASRVAADTSPQASVNWSGYAAVSPTTEAVPSADSALSFSDVTASWTQPKARCVRGRSDAAAFWVGIGGFNEDALTLQQLGTTAQCSNRGVATYFVWWEIVPAAEVRVPMKVRAGDRVTAAVLVNGSRVTMSIKNATRRTRFSTTVTVSRPLDVSSAEWIAEAPTACTSNGVCEVVPLTNFAGVTFSKAAATANHVSGTITDPTWLATPLQLIPNASAGGSGASPGALSADGRSFRVSWQRVASRSEVAATAPVSRAAGTGAIVMQVQSAVPVSP